MSFLTGTRGRYRQLSNLEPKQQFLKNQLFGASSGAFQDVADYYRNILSGQDGTMDALAAPELRRFNEEIIPGLAEQFAGMGASGSGLSGTSFGLAAGRAGADLGERLGAIRAQLRQQAAQGLMGLGQQGLQSFIQNVYEPATPGLLQSIAPIAGTVAGSIFGGPIGSAIGGGLGNLFGGDTKKGSTGPYGSSPSRSSIANWKPPVRPEVGFLKGM